MLLCNIYVQVQRNIFPACMDGISMKKKMSSILKKCKSLTSTKLSSRSSSYSTGSYSLRRDEQSLSADDGGAAEAVVFVGSSRRRYTISAKHLSHPLINALIDRGTTPTSSGEEEMVMSVKCEVVLFDHLLWMLDNADPDEVAADASQLEELAQLYSC